MSIEYLEKVKRYLEIIKGLEVISTKVLEDEKFAILFDGGSYPLYGWDKRSMVDARTRLAGKMGRTIY